MAIKETEKTVILENGYVALTLSKADGALLSVKTAGGEELLGEVAPFFYLADEAFAPFGNTGLSLSEGVFSLQTEIGEVKIAVTAREEYFIFEVLSALPKGAYCLCLASAKYTYERDDEAAYRAGGVAMTVSVDPVYFPDGYARETVARIYEHLEGAKGARYGLAIRPNGALREALKALGVLLEA